MFLYIVRVRYLIMIQNGENYIVEARIAYKDGLQYDYVYGKCEIVDAEKEVGFMLKRSENWFIRVTGNNEEVIIPGCRVGTLVKCEKPILPKKTDNDGSRSYRDEPARLLLL